MSELARLSFVVSRGCLLLGMVENLDSKGGDEDGTDADRAKVSAEDDPTEGFDIGNPLV